MLGPRAAEVSGVDILAIAGSPRRGGNTDRLLDAFLAAAEEAGASTERVMPSEEDIGFCRGCNACSMDGECIVDDGMQRIYPLLNSARSLVIASPVYFASVPASLKAFYDRCQPFWARRYILGYQLTERRPAALLLVRGGGDPYGSEAAIATTRSVLAVLGMDLEELVEAEGADKADEIESDPEAIAAAADAGARMAGRLLGTDGE